MRSRGCVSARADRRDLGRRTEMKHPLTDRAAIVGIGQTDFSKNSGRTEAKLAAQAIKAALDDAGLSAEDVDGLVTFTMDSNPETAIVSTLGFNNLRYFGEVGYGGSAHGA